MESILWEWARTRLIKIAQWPTARSRRSRSTILMTGGPESNAKAFICNKCQRLQQRHWRQQIAEQQRPSIKDAEARQKAARNHQEALLLLHTASPRLKSTWALTQAAQKSTRTFWNSDKLWKRPLSRASTSAKTWRISIRVCKQKRSWTMPWRLEAAIQATGCSTMQSQIQSQAMRYRKSIAPKWQTGWSKFAHLSNVPLGLISWRFNSSINT